jgi:hypothetical protein
MSLPLLAASDYGIMIGSGFVLFMFMVVGWVIVQGTRAQLAWRKLVDEGDVNAIQTLVGEEVQRWKTARTPKGVAPSLWHGVQSTELLEVSSALKEGFRLTARLADMLMYDIPNVKLPYAQIDIYSTYRDESGSSQRCIMSTLCQREVADVIDWDEMDGEEIVRAFGGRFSLDGRGNPNPIDPDMTGRSDVPAVFYKD